MRFWHCARRHHYWLWLRLRQCKRADAILPAFHRNDKRQFARRDEWQTAAGAKKWNKCSGMPSSGTHARFSSGLLQLPFSRLPRSHAKKKSIHTVLYVRRTYFDGMAFNTYQHSIKMTLSICVCLGCLPAQWCMHVCVFVCVCLRSVALIYWIISSTFEKRHLFSFLCQWVLLDARSKNSPILIRKLIVRAGAELCRYDRQIIRRICHEPAFSVVAREWPPVFVAKVLMQNSGIAARFE